MNYEKIICKFTASILCLLILVNNSYVLNTIDKVRATDILIEDALRWAISIANDDKHGYSQTNRQGPDYDCSSLVINALRYAGIKTGAASYTGDLKDELTKNGFTWIPWSEINNVSSLMRGDILLRRDSNSGHTEFYLGKGQNVGAHSDRGNPKTGDQTGTEISVCKYWEGKWNGVLRYNFVIVETPKGYFDSCGSTYTSIVEALKSIGAESSYSYRVKIAVANGISGYSGTATQNTQMLNMLKSGELKVPVDSPENNVPNPPQVNDFSYTYFPACNSSYTSFVDALKSIGVDSSYSYRTTIANKNGVAGYSGSSTQNTQLLSLLKNGKLLNPNAMSLPVSNTSGKYFVACNSSYTSFVDALKSIGVDSSYSYRTTIANKNGVAGYSGSSTQNTELLNLLKYGKLIKPEYVEQTVVSNCVVSLNANGGDSPISSMTITTNDTYKGLPIAIREGYSFVGWYTDPNGGSVINDGNAIASSLNHILYARWKANTYMVSFENNDGTGITGSKEIVYDSNYGELINPSRIGYTFIGWYTDIRSGIEVQSNSKFTLADNQTLYAHWEANKYTVILDFNDGTERTKMHYVIYDGIYGEIENLKREGYNFIGWFTSKDGGNQIFSESQVSINLNQTLYAKWEKTTMDEESLRIDTTSITLKNGEQYTIKANQSNLIYKSNNSNVAVVSNKGIVTALEEGTAVISVINSDSEVVQLKLTVISSIVLGDCNNDGEFTLSDIVVLQKYLLSISKELDNWKAIDFYEDGKIDIFDLILMKNKFIES